MDKRIMIVDDDPDILIFLRTVFEQQDYEVLTVDSGTDCIDELQRGFKGVILMDLKMPFMDGWDTLRQIIEKQLYKDIIITIISAHGTIEHEKMNGLEGYIYDYITKPFDLQKLIIEINDLTLKRDA
ncbi:MAG: response regulator [Candidatus Thermoplasmatota archaeon]